MNPNDVIEAFVRDVMRRLPARMRNDIGMELRGLLAEMLDDHALREGRAADDAMTLAMLRAFGTPAEVATRYRPPGVVVIPPEGTRMFALLSLLGIGVQWALTLPRVFDGQPLAAWWLGAGLGAFWWPGFIAMMALLGAGLRHAGWYTPRWTPRVVDPDRVRRGPAVAALIGIAAGALFTGSLPWLAPHLPGPMPAVFAFDPTFLHVRAWPVVVLWTATFALRLHVLRHGRWTTALRQAEQGLGLAFIALMAWWIGAGRIFLAPATDQGAKAALALVLVISLASLAISLHREHTRIRPAIVPG